MVTVERKGQPTTPRFSHVLDDLTQTGHELSFYFKHKRQGDASAIHNIRTVSIRRDQRLVDLLEHKRQGQIPFGYDVEVSVNRFTGTAPAETLHPYSRNEVNFTIHTPSSADYNIKTFFSSLRKAGGFQSPEEVVNLLGDSAITVPEALPDYLQRTVKEVEETSRALHTGVSRQERVTDEVREASELAEIDLFSNRIAYFKSEGVVFAADMAQDIDNPLLAVTAKSQDARPVDFLALSPHRIANYQRRSLYAHHLAQLVS